MPSCAVVGCTSGHQSNPEKNHIFRVPKNPLILNLWIKALEPSGRRFRPMQSVCEKHFRSSEILRQREIVRPDGSVVAIGSHKVPRLKRGSVPSIFPWTALMEPKREIPSDEEMDSHDASTAIEDPLSFEVVEEKFTPPSDDARQSFQTDSDENLESIKVESTNDFSVSWPVAAQKLTIQEVANVPAISGWTRQILTCEETVIVQFSFSRCTREGDFFKSFVQKELMVKADMSYQIAVLGMELGTKNRVNIEFSPIDTMQRLQDLLSKLDGLKICIGIIAPVAECGVIDSALCKDPCGSWRHSRCSLLLTVASACSICQKAQQTVMSKIWRLRRKAEDAKITRSKFSLRKKKFR